MRPTRRAAAAKATIANRRLSLSSISSPSEEDEIESGSEVETNDNNSDLSEDDQNELNEMEEDEADDQPDMSVLDEEDELESLSEEEDLVADSQDEEQPEIEDAEPEADEKEGDEDDDTGPAPRKSNSRPNKRKKPVAYDNSDEELIFSDDAETEILRNKPMTKRQRAKMNRETPEEYLELPMDTGKKKFLTEEEEQLRRSEVARRRKNQSIQRAEKDKADTINRLLKKQATKSKRVIEDTTEDKDSAQEKSKRLQDSNSLRYINNKDGSRLNIPAVYTIEVLFGLPIGSSARPQQRKIQQCQIDGCTKGRKYTAKKSGKVVCSLEHYKMAEAN